jgi:phosphinothricin acetyltransferase
LAPVDPSHSDTSGASVGTRALVIRDALESDMDRVAAIYAHYVRHGLATFEEVAPSGDDLRERRAAVLARALPYLVAVRDGEILGFSYATAYRPRPAYRFTVEDSVYVANGLSGQGIGSLLLASLIARCESGPWRQMLAIIGDSANQGSIAVHRRAGFRHVGILEGVGFKLGRWVDTVLMQRELGEGRKTPADTSFTG